MLLAWFRSESPRWRSAQTVTGPKVPHAQSRYARVYAKPGPASDITLDQRKTATLRARVRLNRHHLRSRKWALLMIDASLCPACRSLQAVVEESPEHVFIECPRFNTARLHLATECQYHGVALTMPLITGDFSNVPPERVEDIRIATAMFLHTVDQCLHI